MLPNLFRFATSELSQDAVLCWLLSWADIKHMESHPHLHGVAKEIVNSIFHLANLRAPKEYSSINILKQDVGIDILCIVNNDIAVLIEDKVGTKQHSDQLARYKDHVSNALGYPADKVIPLYIQTGDQCDYADVEKHGYYVLTRQDLLKVFEGKSGRLAKTQSDIFRDFSEYIREIDDDVNSYLKLPLSDWSWNSWKGFYVDIQRRLKSGEWDYVPNATGGFMGFWWHVRDAGECDLYLQLEQDKLCFKISVDEEDKRRVLRSHWHTAITDKCADFGVKAKRPARFGNGQCMTVAVLDQDYRIVNDNGVLDVDKTLIGIRNAESLIDDLC